MLSRLKSNNPFDGAVPVPRLPRLSASGVDFGYLIQTTHLCAAPPTMNCGLRSTKEHSLPTREGPCVVSARTWVCKADQRPSGFKTNWTATRISRSPSCIKPNWRIRTLALNEQYLFGFSIGWQRKAIASIMVFIVDCAKKRG